MSETTRLTSPKEVRGLLAQLGHRPNKGLGQNFLIDANILDIIANNADIQPDDSVLEIGPGLGALTERILPKAGSVTCIEKDPTMAKYLKSRFAGSMGFQPMDHGQDARATVKLVESDALDVDLDALFAGGITKVASNLPYSVANRLMVDIAECGHRPELMSLTIQKEVADRLTAEPGNKHYGMLGILTGLFYKNTLVKKSAPPASFRRRKYGRRWLKWSGAKFQSLELPYIRCSRSWLNPASRSAVSRLEPSSNEWESSRLI